MKSLKKWIALACLAFSSVASAQTFDKFVVFGDSLSDNGNLYAMTKGYEPQAPYYYGRFSNGLVWVEMLSNMMFLSPRHLEDYAVGGAQTEGMKPPGLKSQVDKYLATNTVDPEAIYIVWSGGDNYLYHPHAGIKEINETIDDINQVITELAQHGATNFLVPNLPDIGKTPIAAQWDQQYPHLKTSQHLTWMSKTHNEKLKADIPELEASLGINIMTIDIFGILNEVISNPSKYGYTDVTDRCYTGEFHGGGGTVCSDPDEYLFWDWVHPTLKTHNMIAELAASKLQEAGFKGKQVQ